MYWLVVTWMQYAKKHISCLFTRFFLRRALVVLLPSADSLDAAIASFKWSPRHTHLSKKQKPLSTPVAGCACGGFPISERIETISHAGFVAASRSNCSLAHASPAGQLVGCDTPIHTWPALPHQGRGTLCGGSICWSSTPGNPARIGCMWHIILRMTDTHNPQLLAAFLPRLSTHYYLTSLLLAVTHW